MATGITVWLYLFDYRPLCAQIDMIPGRPPSKIRIPGTTSTFMLSFNREIKIPESEMLRPNSKGTSGQDRLTM